MFYSSGVVEKNQEEEDDNRYLQCKPKEITETTKAPKETMPPLPVDSEAPFKKTVKNLFVIVFLVLFIICAYKTAYILISNGSAQSFIGMFVDGDFQLTQRTLLIGQEDKCLKIFHYWDYHVVLRITYLI